MESWSHGVMESWSHGVMESLTQWFNFFLTSSSICATTSSFAQLR